MYKPLVKAALVGGVAVSVLALGVGSASAAGTYTVKAGSAAKNTVVAITGRTVGADPQISFVEKQSGAQLSCASGTAPGSTRVASGRAGTGIGSITGSGTTWKGCTGPLGLTLAVTGSGTWKINATGSSGDDVTGTITGIAATVTSTNPQAPCSFDVSGSVAIKYVNSRNQLVVPGTAATLKISNVSGCFGLIANGDTAKFKATYKLKADNAAYNPVTITSP